MDEIVLRGWRGLSLRQWEVDTLGPGKCISDMVLSFQTEVLKEQFASKPCAFVSPSTVQFIQQFPDDVIRDVVLSMKELRDYKYAFLPLSDIDVYVTHASHWSLIVMERGDSGIKFKHFDSMNHCNMGSAKRLVDKIVKIMGIQGSEMVALQCPTQPNAYDCGVYVMAYMQALAECEFDHAKAAAQVTIENVVKYRKHVREYLLDLIRSRA